MSGIELGAFSAVILWSGFWIGHYYGSLRSKAEKSRDFLAQRIIEDARACKANRRLVGKGPTIKVESSWMLGEVGHFKIAVADNPPQEEE